MTTSRVATAAGEVPTASWSDPAGTATGGSRIVGQLSLGPGPTTSVIFQAAGATFATIPTSCRPSSIVHRDSSISTNRTQLTCVVDQSPATRVVAIDLDVDDDAAALTVHVAGDVQADFPIRSVTSGPPQGPAGLRLLSSPDFLNADVADLRRGPGFWTQRRSSNGINAEYREAIDNVMDDWSRQRPAAVLVAGDLVEGRWGRDELGTGNFGPVATQPQQRRALRLAARTYYPQWLARFRRHDLDVYPAMGDHEYGDNPWPRSKRALSDAYKDAFARYFTTKGSGGFRFPDHPRGPHATTAYAWRPTPQVQVISLDVFDIDAAHARVGLDDAQRRWLVDVLRRAREDEVTWTVVQAHTPILQPVRARASSQLHYPGGTRSDLWKILARFHVDLYLCGEVHDVTASTADGIVQLAHGGAFEFGLTNYALLDFYTDRLQITLNDVESRSRNAHDKPRPWETLRGGMRPEIKVDPTPFTIGTMTISTSGDVGDRSGILLPYDG